MESISENGRLPSGVGPSAIQLLSETPAYAIFARDNLIALVKRTANGYGAAGSTGLMTERGLAYLIWRDGKAMLAGKGFEAAAMPSSNRKAES